MAHITTFEDYEVLTLPGEPGSRQALIIASGIGDLNLPVPGFDFYETAQRLSPQVTTLIIKDTARSWYNSPKGWKDLLQHIHTELQSRSVNDVTAVGLSMGGFGAFVLAHELNSIHRVVALSTRCVLDANDALDRRNQALIAGIKNTAYRNLNALIRPHCDYTAIFSIDEPEDIVQAYRFTPNTVRLLATTGSHNIATTLQQQGSTQLSSFLIACTQNLPNPEEYGLFTPSESVHNWALEFIHHHR